MGGWVWEDKQDFEAVGGIRYKMGAGKKELRRVK
jgi:hypothetical protein